MESDQYSVSDDCVIQRQDWEILWIQLDMVYGGHFQTQTELIKRMVAFLKKFQESSQ